MSFVTITREGEIAVVAVNNPPVNALGQMRSVRWMPIRPSGPWC